MNSATTEAASNIDTNAPACGMTIRTASGLARCDSPRMQYTASRGQAQRKCCGCGNASRVDIAYDVTRKIKTVEQWRAWWKRIDER